MKPLNSVFFAIGFVAVMLVTMPASAGGVASAQIQYNSTTNYASGGNYNRPVIVKQYPNGRVEVIAVPVVHVYPNGESLVYQNGGQRVYSQGYGGAATCYVECWHNGVSPNSNSGSHFSVGVGVQGNW
jgi:hypothetical protein